MILTFNRLAYGWKLALVGTSILPVGFAAGYLRVRLLGACDATLRKAFEKSAAMACEQVAAIRTVVSLNREMALYREYHESLAEPVTKAMHSTLQISSVLCFFCRPANNSSMPLANVCPSLLTPFCTGMDLPS